ncbi:hypothetical protein SALBM311S_07293 [Streptomyces alboniger]
MVFRHRTGTANLGGYEKMPTGFPKRRLAAGAALVVAALVTTTACGGGDGDDKGEKGASY